MKIAFYSTKPYDKLFFEPLNREKYGFTIDFLESPCKEASISLARGYDAICIFVNDHVTAPMVEELYQMGVKGILLRSAGYNHVDLEAAKGKIEVLRVPSYSPEAVAEYAMAMLLTVNRYTHKAYTRTREFNMNINGLMGRDLFHKTAGIVGTGKIGQAMIRICRGFSMDVIAYDPYPNEESGIKYVSKEELFRESDVISLHCPLTEETKHLIDKESIGQMKKGIYLVNTSRGSLIDTPYLIQGLIQGVFAGVGLDVYEEEEGVFYEDRSNDIMMDEGLARLTSFPNVLISSHMGFFTREATKAIAEVTLENAYALEQGKELKNSVLS